MTFANPLPWWALVPLLAGAGTIAWLAYRGAPLARGKRSTLSALRLLTLLLLLVLLMRPVAPSGPEGPADAIVPILVDTSRSMSIEDADGMRRIDRARQLLGAELLPALAPRFTTEVLGFGESVVPVAPAALGATARRSDLAAALQTVRERYRGRPVPGIVLLSDGGDTSPGDRPPADAGAPVFPIGIGSRTLRQDREVLSVTAAEAVFDDSRIDLAVSAVAHEHGTDPLELRLLENGRLLEVRRVAPSAPATPVTEVFQVAPGRGAPTVYTVEIPADAGELVPENNRRSVLVQPPSRARQVLLVQGAPGFEGSFLRRAWSADSGLQVDSVVRKGRNEQGADTFYIQAAASRSASLASGYPATPEDLFGYDAVVLANVDAAALTAAQLQATRDFVGRRGGGLLVLGGQSFLRRRPADTPLDELLPLHMSERAVDAVPASASGAAGAHRVTVTPAGEAHPVMQLGPTPGESRKRWDSVPALAAITSLGGPRPGAAVLAVTSGAAGMRTLVAVQRYGDGRSMVFTGEASWRWRMQLPSSDRSYDTFWRQALRWVALPASEPIAIAAPAGAAPGDVITWRVAARDRSFGPLRDAAVAVRVTKPDGEVETVQAGMDRAAGQEGVYLARYRPMERGVYRATADVRRKGGPPATASTSLLVGGADSEMTDPRLNLHGLQRIAAASGGHMVSAGGIRALADTLREAAPAAALLVRRDLWHNGLSLAAIISLLAAEWLLRRRWGLR